LRFGPAPATVPDMVTWEEFSHARPELARAGRALIYQFGVGLAFLATIRGDGGPRVHPMCPLITEDGLFALLVPSPKRDDLRAQFLTERRMEALPPGFADHESFEFGIQRCLHTMTTGHGDPSPRHEVSRAP
jgi:hypothetical protein